MRVNDLRMLPGKPARPLSKIGRHAIAHAAALDQARRQEIRRRMSERIARILEEQAQRERDGQ
jgi:hypothetical protein